MKTGNPSSSPPPVLLCAGPEKWLKAQAIERLKSLCILPGFEEMDMATFDQTQEYDQAIMEAVKTAPFGSPYRLVIISGLDEASIDSLPWLVHYLNGPNPKASVVLCAEKISEEIRSLAQKKPDVVHLLWCHPLKGRDLRDWVVNQARLLDKTLDSAAAHLLIARCGDQLQSLFLAVEALSLLVGSAAKITEADVEAIISPSVRETVFDILDRAAAGQPQKAIELLHQALAQGQLTVEQLMGALGWYYRMVWKNKTGMGSSWGSADRQTALSRLKRWPQQKLKAALDEVLEADTRLKLGYPSSELLADQLLLKLGA